MSNDISNDRKIKLEDLPPFTLTDEQIKSLRWNESKEVAELRAQLDAANAAKAQAEADARHFAELVDGGNFSLELQQRIDKYLEAK